MDCHYSYNFNNHLFHKVTIIKVKLQITYNKLFKYEVAKVTTVVSYKPNSKLPKHTHEFGGEILVLKVSFSDEMGDHREAFI